MSYDIHGMTRGDLENHYYAISSAYHALATRCQQLVIEKSLLVVQLQSQSVGSSLRILPSDFKRQHIQARNRRDQEMDQKKRTGSRNGHHAV